MQVAAKCQFCNNEKAGKLGYTRDYLVTQDLFYIVKCNECGFVFTFPKPRDHELNQYYASDDYISHTDAKKSFQDKIYQWVKRYMINKKCKIIRKHMSGHDLVRILDFGCATGDFLAEAQKQEMDAWGYEPNAAARDKAISKGVKVLAEVPVASTHSPHDKYHVITLWHVLEHIPDLNEKISLFSQLLHENGLIVVAVPEYRSYDAKKYGMNWAAWDVPRHLYHFDEITLTRWFATNQMRLVQKHPLAFDAFYVALLSEKILGRKTSGAVKALVNGLKSNFFAWQKKYPYSSQVYIFTKETNGNTNKVI